MPTPRHGKTTGVYLAGFNASPFFNSFETARTVDTHETTPFESNEKTYMAGLSDGTMTLSGFYDVNATDALSGDSLLDALRVNDSEFPASIFLDGGVVVGRNCRMANVFQSQYTVSGAVADMVTTKAEFKVDGGVRFGKCLNAKAPVTTAVITGASCDYGISPGDFIAGNNGYLNIHPIANTLSQTCNVKLQQSADNSVWVDYQSYTIPAGSTTGVVLPTTGANLRYVRALITPVAGTGSATIIVAFARA